MQKLCDVKFIDLGRQGENNARTVEIDATADVAGFTHPNVYALVKRPRESAPYVATSTFEAGILRWPISDVDTAINGHGQVEIRITDGDKLIKPVYVPTYVAPAMDGDTGDPPDALDSWADRLESAEKAALEAAGTVQAVVDRFDDPDVVVESVAYGEPGSGEWVDASGTPTLKLSIPAGKPGEKGDQGAPGADGKQGEKGDPGDPAPQIDDDKITASNPWSSKKIIDTLCPPFEKIGEVVTCTPVAGYPLGVQVEIIPKQDGEGDPSPENIRQIVLVENINAIRCWKNLLDFSSFVEYENWSANLVTEGHPSAITNANNRAFMLPCKSGETYTISFSIANGFPSYLYLCKINSSGLGERIAYLTTDIVHNLSFTFSLEIDERAYLRLGSTISQSTFDENISKINSVQIESGDTTTAYEPYRGDTYAVDLPEPCYGGVVDVTGGKVQMDFNVIQFDGTETNWIYANSSLTGLKYFELNLKYGKDNKLPLSMGNHVLAKTQQRMSNFVIGDPYSESVDNAGWVYATEGGRETIVRIRMSAASSVDAWKTYLSEQHAAGTPVTIVYKLAEPETLSTEPQPIAALSRTNVIYSDAGPVTVTGRADPINTIDALTQRVAALEATATNIPEV